MKINNPVMLNAVANSGTKLSSAIDAYFVMQGTIQVVPTDGTAAGTLTLQGSNDPVEKLPAGEAPQNWSDIANVAVTSGAVKFIPYAPYTGGSFRWLRAKWVQSGGAGTVTVNGFFQGM